MNFTVTVAIALLSTAVLLFTGCSTAPTQIPVLPIKCGQYLDKEALTYCSDLVKLPESLTYSDLLKETGELQSRYKQCAAKHKVLADTLEACKALK
jgi:hypothetical protein